MTSIDRIEYLVIQCNRVDSLFIHVDQIQDVIDRVINSKLEKNSKYVTRIMFIKTKNKMKYTQQTIKEYTEETISSTVKYITDRLPNHCVDNNYMIIKCPHIRTAFKIIKILNIYDEFFDATKVRNITTIEEGLIMLTLSEN